MDQDRSRLNLEEPRRVTIREVARAAGVSVSTASKALNEQGRMSPETRDRVRQIARDVGFRPNAVARALVGKRSFTLGLITNDTYGRFTLPVAAGLASAMASKGVSVFLCAVDDDPARVRLSIEAMEDKRVDGLVIAGKRIDRAPPLENRRPAMPVVYANAATPPEGVGFVPDDKRGGALAARHLLSLGRRRLAHISGPEDFAAVALRAAGWCQVLRDAGLEPYGKSLHGSWSEAFGYETGLFLRERLGTERYPDAVFCGNDQIARGLIDALQVRQIRVPEDIAVVGYDNWDIFARATRPPLTTIDMALTRLGECAGLTLLDMIAGKAVEPGLRKLPCHLVMRQSCGGEQIGDAT
ncbi:LacI family DNA-binding transcriptional regulator [Acidisoma cellulosilytica]|uniref:LacI family DNA-binding transcriptional regulator n=1 Tax=Acidisoma cellulosilyticum TaxID=2802395 RepID=A0A963Z576_9PROT|nr:LacI family DNA-binding transcriptional regulator [Acidisoma cellulosilyticum]MCB8883105.1 LacI family DNA-binding transcriptional regulator [Acidisoma cellulosilyticum]